MFGERRRRGHGSGGGDAVGPGAGGGDLVVLEDGARCDQGLVDDVRLFGAGEGGPEVLVAGGYRIDVGADFAWNGRNEVGFGSLKYNFWVELYKVCQTANCQYYK